MSIETWFIYALAILLLTASPGPSVLLCASKSITSGLASAKWAALGSVTAISIILTLSFTGLGVLIASSHYAFTLIKWMGAAYLVYLGLKALRSSDESYEIDTSNDSKTGNRGDFASGFIVGASNPKALVFFTALFPQFIDPAAALFPQYLVFASTFIALELGWLLFYAHLANKSSTWFMAKGRARYFNRLTGATFVLAGIFLATTKRAVH